MSRYSLKTKVTLIFPLGVTVAIAALLFLIYTLMQGYVKESIASQQFRILTILADDIDRTLLENQKTLAGIAAKISPEMAHSPEKSMAYLRLQQDFLGKFDNGMFLFDSSGKMLAELPLGLERAGRDFSYRDYLKETKASLKPFISEPYQSSKTNNPPSIMFTAPVIGSDGTLLAVLGGSIDLTKTSFLEKLFQIKLGKGGYVYLYNKQRSLIIHPDKSRIMKQDVPLGANRLFDRSIEGFEGTGETVTSRGIKTFSSFKHLKVKPWIIAANYPLAEAFAPLYRLRIFFICILPLISIVIFLLMRRYLGRLTDPIVKLTRHMEDLGNKQGNARLFTEQGVDDVHTLGKAFNELIQETDRQRENIQAELETRKQTDIRLHRQNEYLLALHETTLGLIRRLDVDGLLQAIVMRAGKLIGTTHCFVYLKNAAGTEMNMVYQSGIYDSLDHHPIVRGQGIAGLVWETGEPFHVDNYSQWPNRLQNPDRNVLRAMAGVPLKAGAEVVGALGLAFIEEGIIFNNDMMDLLAQFGELASLALENARLVEDSRRELAERKKIERNIRKLSHAVEQSPLSIIITDIHGTIEYANPHFVALTGYSSEELVGQNPRILKSGFTSYQDYKKLWETILAGKEWQGEFHNQKKNGELYWENALISPIRTPDGAITHFIAIKEDITERKKLENQLHHAQKMEAVGQLAGGIAHDFNNILTAIIGYASIMQMKLPDESPFKVSAGQILATAERGAALTQGLLAFSRKQSSNPMAINLHDILHRSENLLRRLIGEDIQLVWNLTDSPLPVVADSIQIEQVLMNLSTNARDAMSDGGVITVGTECVFIDTPFIVSHGFGEPGRYAMISFTDTGEGMDNDTAVHVFEPFYTTKETGKGTGLGLSIVYGIIKKHNGYITCHSQPGLGTIFHIYLPLSDAHLISTQNETTVDVSYEGGTELILVVEDDEAARTLSVELLQEFGYTVISAADGLEALEKFTIHREQVSLVILDAILPGMKGVEVFTKLRSIRNDIPVLFCSGYSEDIIKVMDCIGERPHFIPKPFMPKEMLMKIREVLNHAV